MKKLHWLCRAEKAENDARAVPRIKIMNKHLLFLVLTILLLTGSAAAQVKRKPIKFTPEQLAAAVLKAFKAKDFSKLNAARLYLKSLEVAFRSDYEYTTTVKTAKTLKQATQEMFYDAKGKPADVNTSSGALKNCRKGICRYDVAVTAHNTIFLESITYGMKNGSAYIKRITFAAD